METLVSHRPMWTVVCNGDTNGSIDAITHIKCLYASIFTPQPERGQYNLTSIRPSVRTSVDSDFSEVYGSNSLN